MASSDVIKDSMRRKVPEALAKLLDRLKEQERQKLEKRAAVRRERTATVEKDW